MAAIAHLYTTYKITKVGTLKNDKLSSMLLLKQSLQDFGYNYNYNDATKIFDTILNNKFEKGFDLKFKFVLDTIFDNMEYEELLNNNYHFEHIDYKAFMFIDETSCQCNNCNIVKKCARLSTLGNDMLVICKDCLQNIINQFE